MGAYTATATTIAGRNGHVISSDEVLDFDLSLPKAMGGPGTAGATNPEQLFAAGYSACFGSAIAAVAGAQHVKPEEIRVTADITIDKNDGGFFLAARLTARLAGVDRATAERIVHAAHEMCPYSKATRNNIDVELVIA
jgi:Ohr subfamily peroxiredoxin